MASFGDFSLAIRRNSRFLSATADTPSLPPLTVECSVGMDLPALSSLITELENFDPLDFDSFCHSFPYREFLDFAQENLDSEIGALHLRCFAACSRSPFFPSDSFCSATDLLFFLICLSQPSETVPTDALFALAILCHSKPPLLSILCDFGLIDRLSSLPISEPLSFLIQLLCLSEDSLAAAAIPFIPSLLRSGESAIVRRGMKCFGILSLKGAARALSPAFLSRAEEFLESPDPLLREAFLEVLPLADPRPTALVPCVLALLEASDSSRTVRLCASFLFGEALDREAGVRLCGALLARVPGAEYAVERCGARVVARFYGAVGDRDREAVALFLRYAADEADCLRALCRVLEAHAADLPGFLGDALPEALAVASEAAERFGGDDGAIAEALFDALDGGSW
jgi:hypothetical protein